jgi:LPPG:FO 2-phospho-L-lactate transferase
VQIVILAGGVGGSKFVAGVRRGWPDADVTVIVNTADDITLHGLRICPDLDTMMYTLGGGSDTDRGWGRAGESWRVKDELAAYGVEPAWFGLGDLDLATHLVRTQMLDAGYPLSQVTEALCARWLGDDPRLRLVPMSDDRVETHIVIADDEQPGGRRAVHFQEYWVRLHAEPEALGVIPVGAEQARATPGLVDTVAAADLILVAPSNPVVSIGPILAVADLRAALVAAPAPVIGFAGILGGAPVLGMAHRLLPAIGVPVDAGAVGIHYGARTVGGVLDAWVMDHADEQALAACEAAGLPASTADLIMRDVDATAKFVRFAVESALPSS